MSGIGLLIIATLAIGLYFVPELREYVGYSVMAVAAIGAIVLIGGSMGHRRP